MHDKMHHVKENIHETHEVLDWLHGQIITWIKKEMNKPSPHMPQELTAMAAAIHYIAEAEESLIDSHHMHMHMQKMHGAPEGHSPTDIRY